MKATASLVAAALCMVFAGAARAQDGGGTLVDPSAGDPDAEGGLSIGSAGEQPIDESATYDDGHDPTAYMHFEGDLAPYGDWQTDPRYGRVWSPSPGAVGADFAPYVTGGGWALSQYGWTWVSTYPWGWAPFHYGRWVTLAARGWAWVPGTTWGPAWVSWRAGDGYVGWAPLPPAGLALASPTEGASYWRFVPAAQLGAAQPTPLAPGAVASIYPRTACFNPARTMTVNEHVVRYNPGPLGLARRSALRAAPLPPNALPRGHISPPRALPMDAAPPGGPVAPSYWTGRPAYAPAAPFAARPAYASPPIDPNQPWGYGWPPWRGRAAYPSTAYGPPGHPPGGYPSAAPGYGAPQWGVSRGFVGGGIHPWSGRQGGFVGGGRRGR